MAPLFYNMIHNLLNIFANKNAHYYRRPSKAVLFNLSIRMCNRVQYNPIQNTGVLPYMSYIGICGPKAYGFVAALVRRRVSILTILISNRV